MRDILTVWNVLNIDSSMEILNTIIAYFHLSSSKLSLTILETELQYIADLCSYFVDHNFLRVVNSDSIVRPLSIYM